MDAGKGGQGMEYRLQENIRLARRQRGLTQEQLAEALGVSTGAISKWEAGQSLPGLDMLVSIADLFDMSVDALLGYELRDNRQDAVVERLKRAMLEKDEAGLDEAEKALMRYPNSFEVVYHSARMYFNFGFEQGDATKLRRAIELFQRTTPLLAQNTDGKISELTIDVYIAEAYTSIGKHDEAVKILQRNNPNGINDALIGMMLATRCNRPDEAGTVLSEALLECISMLVRIAMGYINLYTQRNEPEPLRLFMSWAIATFDGLKSPDGICIIDKITAIFHGCLAWAQLRCDLRDEAMKSLMIAKAQAERFDADPDYRVNRLRFTSNQDTGTAYDDLGTTAMEALRRGIHSTEDETLIAMWNDLAVVE